MADGSRTDRGIVAKTAALVASRLDDQLETATRSIQQLLVTEITELAGMRSWCSCCATR